MTNRLDKLRTLIESRHAETPAAQRLSWIDRAGYLSRSPIGKVNLQMTAQIVCLEMVRKAKALPVAPSGLLREKQPVERGRGITATVKREEHRWADHRNEPRHQVEGRCLPFVSLNGTTARLENVSRSGLMVHSVVEASLGSTVMVAIAGCRLVSACVIWKRGDKIGLKAPLVWESPM